MSIFRTLRPLIVDAVQCQSPQSIPTDLGPRQVHIGDWIVRGENGERYVVDNAFFQRTFTALPGAHGVVQECEGRHYGS
jgi:hypothetical protein